MRRFLVSIASLAAFGGTTLAQSKNRSTDPAPGESFVYGISGGKPRHLKIHFPPGHDRAKSRVSGLILFHGGGWSGGTPAQFRAACAYFASRGMVAATAVYWMLAKDDAAKLPAGEARKQVCVEDVRTAIRWMKSNAERLSVDPARIVTGGGSAGGHVSVPATTNPGSMRIRRSRTARTPPSRRIYFSTRHFRRRTPPIPKLKPCEMPVPVFHPRSFFFGTIDKWKTGWDALRGKLESQGNASDRVIPAEGQPHGFFNRDPWRTITLIEAGRFLEKRGLLAGPPTLAEPEIAEKLQLERHE